MAFGRKFTKRTFLALSPNKTWEGFVGGELSLSLSLGLTLSLSLSLSLTLSLHARAEA